MTTVWYLGRGAGVVTLALFSLVVALGVVTRSARPLPGLPRFAVQRVHRSTSLLALAFLTLHITLVVTGVLRARIPQRTWRALHWLAYLMWPVAASHALLAGTDRAQVWLLVIWSGCLLLVLGAVAWRLTPDFQDRTTFRRRVPVGSVAR